MHHMNRAERPARVDARLVADIIESSGRITKVIVTDISSGGFRMETEAQLRAGDRVTLRVPRDGDYQAQIRWALETQAGGEFLEPVTPPPL